MGETPKPKARILVVDDAALVRLYYRDGLERSGFEVDEAMNGLEALETLIAAPAGGEAFDLVIVDVNMPKMDGFTFLETLRRMEGTVSSIPALVTSTEAAPGDVAAARAAGANFYLVKPVSQDTLSEHAAMLCGVAP